MTWGIFIVSISYLLLFGIGEIAFHYFKANGETSRKLVHFGSGVIGLFLPNLISNHWVILCLSIAFASILYISQRWSFLKSINSVERNTLGSTLFPLVLYLCFLENTRQHNLLFYYTPILVLAICDPMAAIAGKKWPYGKYAILGSLKTVTGSFVFWVGSTLVLFVMMTMMTELSVIKICFFSIIISLVASAMEGISVNGFDNVTVPLTVLGLLMLFI